MFFDISPLEMIALVVIGVIIFGPERLPKLAADTARFLRRFREFSQGAREDIRRELGPEFSDFRFEDLNPKSFVRRNLLGDDDLGFDLKDFPELKDLPDLQDFRFDDRPTAKARDSGPRLEAGERPPFDVDAT